MKSERNLFIISLLTFVTVVSWITFELVKTTRTTTVSASVQQLLTPLTPTIDLDTLNILEGRQL